MWYQKIVEIPASWNEQQIILKLERVLWESQVWVNGELAGKGESLSTPHTYDISEYLEAGTNRIVIRVDNSNKYPGKGLSRLFEEALVILLY